MSYLTRLANKYKSDKGDAVGAKHNYTPIYDFMLRPYQDKPIRFLEIGLLRGGPELGHSADRETTAPPSIQMWLEYFSKADIVGFDISDFSMYETERFSFFRGDSGDANTLQDLLKKHGPFDIVLDDASHASFHQLKAFEQLFPALNAGGLYIIEDLHWQPPTIEAALPKCPTGRDFVNWASGFIHDDNFNLPPELSGLKSTFNMIEFCQGFPGFRTGLHGVKTSVFTRKPE
jgi:hypothetical protein